MIDERDNERGKSAKSKIRLARIKELARYKKLMSDPDNRAAVWAIRTMSGIAVNPFSTNALSMSFLTGMQNVWRLIESELLTACPEFVLQMQVEANSLDRNEDQPKEDSDA